MKILHFIYDHLNNPWIGGGGAVRAYEIYKRLSKKGYKITVVSGKYPNCIDYNEENLSFKFLGFEKNYIISTFSYTYMARKYLKRFYDAYDIIIEDFAPWNPLFSYKIQSKKIIILQIQNYLGMEIIKKYIIFGFPFYILEKYYPLKFKNIIVLSKVLNKRWNINGVVIPSGYESFLNLNKNNENYIAFLGRIDIYQKGLDILINTAKELPSINFYVAGEGKDLKRFLKKINQINNIKYLGKLTGKNKYEFISNSKFLIMPFRFEGLGIVAIEAAAMGKPLIVSNISELNYIVENNFGISFKNEDINDLKEKIKYLYNNENLIKEMGNKGKEFAQEYKWDKIAEKFENYLKNIYKEI